jgi:hypothetical protein
MDSKLSSKIESLQSWSDQKPDSPAKWADDVREESLHVKYDYQLEELRNNLTTKVNKIQKDLDMFDDWDQVVKYKLYREFSGQGKDLEDRDILDSVEDEFSSQYDFYKYKILKLQQSLERVEMEIHLRTSGYLTVIEVSGKDSNKDLFIKTEEAKSVRASGSTIRVPLGTTYYIDADNGDDGADGLTPTGDTTNGPWKTLDRYTENARSAGDVAILRRGTTTLYDNNTDLNFTSDGTIVNPIVIEPVGMSVKVAGNSLNIPLIEAEIAVWSLLINIFPSVLTSVHGGF